MRSCYYLEYTYLNSIVILSLFDILSFYPKIFLGNGIKDLVFLYFLMVCESHRFFFFENSNQLLSLSKPSLSLYITFMIMATCCHAFVSSCLHGLCLPTSLPTLLFSFIQVEDYKILSWELFAICLLYHAKMLFFTIV